MSHADVKKSMEVAMQPLSEKQNNIDRVIITDKSDPRALRILDEVNKREKENSPKSLDTYNFKSYSKFSIDVDKDSIDTFTNFLASRKDSLSKVDKSEFKQKESEKKDSSDRRRFTRCNTGKSDVSLGKSYRIQIFSKIWGENQYHRQQNVGF